MDDRDRNAAINKIERPGANAPANKPALVRLHSSSSPAPLAWGQFGEQFEDIDKSKHRKSGIQWNRSFGIKLSHASSLDARSAALDSLCESDKVTEQKALGPLHRLLDFFIQLVLEKSENRKFKIWHSRVKADRKYAKC
jgi:hypothetical protein